MIHAQHEPEETLKRLRGLIDEGMLDTSMCDTARELIERLHNMIPKHSMTIRKVVKKKPTHATQLELPLD
jgi:hypothetical protein